VLEAAPPAAEAPAEAAPAAPAERSRFRLRLPKALLVTVLGFLLTAWLVPAMTRQWDDRQKVHELKAGVVSEMASVSAKAMLGGEAVWAAKEAAKEGSGLKPKPTDEERARVADAWGLSTLELGARLRAYFPRSVVRSWEVYAWAVDRFLDASSPSASAVLEDAVTEETPLDPRVADAAVRLIGLFPDPPAPTFDVSKNMPRSDKKNIARLRAMLSPELERFSESADLAKWTRFEKQLLDLEQAVADQVSDSHVSGYSTTPSDLMHDLLP
jgi:hypothetical protein